MPPLGPKSKVPSPSCAQDLALALARAHVAELKAESLATELAHQEAIAKGFMDRVNHELRTPLNVVMGFTSLAQDGAFGKTEAPLAEALAKIQAAAERLAFLLGDLLDARAIEEGANALDLSLVSPRLCLESLALAIAPILDAKNQQLRLDLDPSLPELILLDRKRIQGVLWAILDNASKFSPLGASIEVLAHGSLGGGMVLQVVDHGIGIAEEALPRIFERFYQADGSTTRQHGGTGLGLALAKGVVDAHGGQLSASHTPGGGTTMSLLLLAQPPEAWVG